MPSSKWKSNFREVQEWLRWHSVCPRLKAKDCSECLVLMCRSAPRVCSCSRWPLRALWATATSATASAATWTHRPRAARQAPISCCHEVVRCSRNCKFFWHIVSFLFFKESTSSASPQSGSRSWRESKTLWSRQPVDAPKPSRWMLCGYRLPPLPWTPRSRRAASLWARPLQGVCRCGAAGSPALSSDTQPRTITCPAAQVRGPACRWPGHAHITARPPLKTKHHVKWTLRLVARRGAPALLRSLVKQWV